MENKESVNMYKDKLNPLGRWLRSCHECNCGSKEIYEYDKENKIKYCIKCKDKKKVE